MQLYLFSGHQNAVQEWFRFEWMWQLALKAHDGVFDRCQLHLAHGDWWLNQFAKRISILIADDKDDKDDAPENSKKVEIVLYNRLQGDSWNQLGIRFPWFLNISECWMSHHHQNKKDVWGRRYTLLYDHYFAFALLCLYILYILEVPLRQCRKGTS